ncbi:cyclophilin-like fold protein [Qiania dongpingensis]|uniref:Cyclophilin-like domain-containing protein n=1 Tax=Qiania dongpingensis TaxID=2763669 RepID=A0A7G9G3C8_9FIRM|nr:cyclophilin-like fold protein [Qiania dongpingensis]QNM05310.1 hypothetical protein H9Q78_12850 [Qiania dongpingensis]
MKKNTLRRPSLLLALSLVFVMILAGCSQTNGTEGDDSPSSTPEVSSVPSSTPDSTDDRGDSSSETAAAAAELYVRFGDNGASFTMHLYDNDTAAAIARHVGTADWRLPIYHYDDYDNWEVMQYYDIPSRYEIPSNPENVTAEQAGTVYYSEPNRIVLFFGDAEVSGEYTPVGYFDATEEFITAVEENPVLEGWGNKIINISADE